jgi:signal transduction histidine kinase
VAVRPRRLTRPVAGGLALTIALGAGGAFGGIAADRSARDAGLDAMRRAARTDAERVRGNIDRAELAARALATVEEVAAFRSAAPEVVRRTAISTVALAPLDDAGNPVVATAVPNPVPPLVRGATVDAVMVRAAIADVGPVTGVAPGGELLVVAPVTTAAAGAPVVDRRQATTAVVVGVIDIATLGDRLFGGGDVRLLADGALVYERGDPSGSLLRATIAIGDRPWMVEADAPPRGTGWVPWAIAAAGLLLGVLAGTVAARAIRRREEAERRADERTRQLGRIAETGGRIQQTLDLGELLPAFALGLADEFDLRHVAISLVDDEGRDVEAFATGIRTGGLPTHQLSLRRGWRHVGVLSVRPRRPLDEAEQTSLQALGDLLAVALTNARLLQREQDAAARLRELDALKNAFLGTVSHELRTSMTAIMGFGELLVDAWDEMSDDRRRELAERVRRSAGSLRHLVDDLLDFARLEQQRLRVSPRPVDLADIVRRTVDSLRSLLADHGLEVHAPDPVAAHVDPLAVERIVANLLSNAAKYSPSGTTVTVRVETVGDRARLAVADQGPGVPAAERNRIFVRFYRLDTEATLRTRGAGIGLSILRDFADRSHATVSVDDAPGGGARFTVDFPTTAVQVDESLSLEEQRS